ncbi:hypothetical protein H5410_031932 [Solanum commersonii]|uniref:Uncharacterized protein n=1 Tax=Solanum commersonii TaxID=4109 RepID=A0A9J5YJM6_SOLCO|nr:hypothetical protein H5410_031932 [Solanum commersonii]
MKTKVKITILLQKIVLADRSFITVCALPSTYVRSGSLGGILLLRETDRRNVECSFDCLFDPSLSGLYVLEQRAECVPLANRQSCLCYTRLNREHTQQDSNYSCKDPTVYLKIQVLTHHSKDSHARNTCY